MFYDSDNYVSDGSYYSSEPSEEEGHEGYFSYSDTPLEYEENSFDSELGWKKLRIKDHKDALPVQYNRKVPIGPTFPFHSHSSFKKINAEHFDTLEVAPHNNTLLLSLKYASDPAETLRYLNSTVSVHHQKYIQHLALDITGSESYFRWRRNVSDISSKEFRDFIGLFIKSFPSTKYLYLNFRESVTQKLTDQDLIWLSLNITKYLPNLKHFAFQFNENNLITTDGFKHFCRQIAKRSKRLEYLSLNFNKCQNIISSCLKSLTRYMTTCLPQLKGLRLNIHITSENDMKNVSFHKERPLKQLESLNLSINEKPNLAGKFQKNLLSLNFLVDPNIQIRLDQLSSSYLQPIQNLKILNFNLSSLNVAEEGIQKFIETLNSKIKTLDHLKIHMPQSLKVTQECLESLTYPENNQLKKLELRFNSTPKENKTPEGRTIRRVVKRKKLNSEAQESAIPTPPVELFPTFTSNFLQRLKNLFYLDLQLQTHIQDLQVKNLATCIAKDLPKLELLNLYFFLCPQITDESVKTFQEEFFAENTLVNLKTLILTFANCHQITKKPIKALRSSFKRRIPAIESATVNFVDYQDDENYASEDDEDYDMARRMVCGWGAHKWKAMKIHPDADPEDENNWRIFARYQLENRESSYYESDGESEDDEDEEDNEGSENPEDEEDDV